MRLNKKGSAMIAAFAFALLSAVAVSSYLALVTSESRMTKRLNNSV